MNRLVRLVQVAIVPMVLGALGAGPASAQESWDAVYVGGAKVGHMHVRVRPVKDSRGRELLNVIVDWELTFKRGNDTVALKQQYGTIETKDGSVLRLDTRTRASDNIIRTRGDVAGDSVMVAPRQRRR